MRVFHYPAGLRPPIPELLREIRAPRPAHILELSENERSRLIAATVPYGRVSAITRVHDYIAAVNRLAAILKQGSL